MKKTDIKIIGLTGGIGSGKTIATNALRAHGYTVIDADEISRTLFSYGSAGERSLMNIFPTATVDGHLDRTALRKIITESGIERERLNAATHPVITAEIYRLLMSAQSNVILSAPLLFESGLDALCDTVVCIYCPLSVQAERIMRRDGVSEISAFNMIASQMPTDDRIRKSDHSINSDIPIGKFEKQVLAMFEKLTDK